MCVAFGKEKFLKLKQVHYVRAKEYNYLGISMKDFEIPAFL